MKEALNSLEYAFYRVRDTLFPPRGLAEHWEYYMRTGKYSYLAERSHERVARMFDEQAKCAREAEQNLPKLWQKLDERARKAEVEFPKLMQRLEERNRKAEREAEKAMKKFLKS